GLFKCLYANIRYQLVEVPLIFWSSSVGEKRVSWENYAAAHDTVVKELISRLQSVQLLGAVWNLVSEDIDFIPLYWSISFDYGELKKITGQDSLEAIKEALKNKFREISDRESEYYLVYRRKGYLFPDSAKSADSYPKIIRAVYVTQWCQMNSIFQLTVCPHYYSPVISKFKFFPAFRYFRSDVKLKFTNKFCGTLLIEPGNFLVYKTTAVVTAHDLRRISGLQSQDIQNVCNIAQNLFNNEGVLYAQYFRGCHTLEGKTGLPNLIARLSFQYDGLGGASPSESCFEKHAKNLGQLIQRLFNRNSLTLPVLITQVSNLPERFEINSPSWLGSHRMVTLSGHVMDPIRWNAAQERHTLYYRDFETYLSKSLFLDCLVVLIFFRYCFGDDIHPKKRRQPNSSNLCLIPLLFTTDLFAPKIPPTPLIATNILYEICLLSKFGVKTLLYLGLPKILDALVNIKPKTPSAAADPGEVPTYEESYRSSVDRLIAALDQLNIRDFVWYLMPVDFKFPSPIWKISFDYLSLAKSFKLKKKTEIQAQLKEVLQTLASTEGLDYTLEVLGTFEEELLYMIGQKIHERTRQCADWQFTLKPLGSAKMLINFIMLSTVRSLMGSITHLSYYFSATQASAAGLFDYQLSDQRDLYSSLPINNTENNTLLSPRDSSNIGDFNARISCQIGKQDVNQTNTLVPKTLMEQPFWFGSSFFSCARARDYGSYFLLARIQLKAENFGPMNVDEQCLISGLGLPAAISPLKTEIGAFEMDGNEFTGHYNIILDANVLNKQIHDAILLAISRQSTPIQEPYDRVISTDSLRLVNRVLNRCFKVPSDKESRTPSLLRGRTNFGDLYSRNMRTYGIWNFRDKTASAAYCAILRYLMVVGCQPLENCEFRRVLHLQTSGMI
ncbi:hypothetical protein CLF_102854, partial [Clonorchis sinensis]